MATNAETETVYYPSDDEMFSSSKPDLQVVTSRIENVPQNHEAQKEPCYDLQALVQNIEQYKQDGPWSTADKPIIKTIAQRLYKIVKKAHASEDVVFDAGSHRKVVTNRDLWAAATGIYHKHCKCL